MSNSTPPTARAAASLTDDRPGNETVFSATSGATEPGEAEIDIIDEVFENPDNITRSSAVRWAADQDSPSFWHLLQQGQQRAAPEKRFDLTRRELDLIIEANAYRPVGHGDVITFGVRGATLRGTEKLENVDSLPLEDARPNHRNFRCVMGYYNRKTGKLSAYTASTVPWHEYIARNVRHNLLPEGCYIYKVGTHAPATRSRWVTPALRLSDAKGAHSGLVTVLRNTDDKVLDHEDEWDQCAPSDNMHCAYSNTGFSSAGCQTIKGGMHDGLWADFQRHLKTLPANARVDYVLFTGLEGAIAASLVKSGADKDAVMTALGRLRFGSEGERVGRLQQKLGLSATGYFGASTKLALTEYQGDHDIITDGVYSPAIDAKLGWGVMLDAPPAPVPTPTPAPSPTPGPVAAPAPTPARPACRATTHSTLRPQLWERPPPGNLSAHWACCS